MQISRSFVVTACIIAINFPLQPLQVQAAGFEILVPHKAVYDVRLRQASERSGIEAMNGRIVYEITGNECEGLTVRYRFVTNISTGETSYQTDQQTSTFESPDGNEFNFVTRTFVDHRPDTIVRGNAVRSPAGVRVTLAEPAERNLELPQAMFMSSHLIELIERAAKGEQFVRTPIFDGSEDGDEIVISSGVIGSPRKVSSLAEGESREAVAALADAPAWPVTISYFVGDPGKTSEALPSYEASFLLYSNGVSRRLVMRYPDYSLIGELSALELTKSTPCVQDQ